MPEDFLIVLGDEEVRFRTPWLSAHTPATAKSNPMCRWPWVRLGRAKAAWMRTCSMPCAREKWGRPERSRRASPLTAPAHCSPARLTAQVGFTEEDYIGLFDETPIPGRTMPPIKPKPKEPAAVGAARAVEESNGSSDGPKPVDYIDGLG